MKVEPGVILDCPPRAPAGGPIPINVQITADARTYYATNGQLQNSLTVALVRRDRPGVMFLANIDPRMWLRPIKPMPPPTADELRSPVLVREQKTFDLLEYGRSHPGAAAYFVLAGFAHWSAGPQPLEVEQPDTILPPGRTESLPVLADPSVLPEFPARPGVAARIVRRAGRVLLEGAFRSTVHPRLWQEDAGEAPFVSVLAFRSHPSGGASAATFRVDGRRAKGEFLATFSVPLTTLSPPPEMGRYVVMAFVGDDLASPMEVDFAQEDLDNE